MTPWPAKDTFDIAAIGKRLFVLLLGVGAYYGTVTWLLLTYGLPGIQRVEAESLINTIILSVLLGFRNRAAYARWWEARGLWGRLVNDSRNLAAKCVAFVPADVVARSGVPEVLAGFPEALKRHLRNEPSSLQSVPGFEQDVATPAHVPLYLARRLFGALASWKKDGHVDQAVLWLLNEHARGLLDVCGGCEKIRNTPLSPSYKALLRMGLLLNVLSAPWILVPENGWWSMPVFLLVCFFLFGVELIDSIVEEPFGSERDDLDLERYCKTIRESVVAIIPPPQRT